MSLLLLDSRVIRYKKLLIVHIIQSIAKNIFSIIDFPKIIANIILMIDTVNKFEDNIPPYHATNNTFIFIFYFYNRFIY